MNTHDNKTRRRLKRLALANIMVQVAFPLAGAFAPAMAAARGHDETVQLMSLPVVPYTLGPGESVASVANHYHLSVAQLQKLNALRTFSKPFTQLGAGDELDVPKTPVQQARSPFAVDRENDTDNDIERNVAGLASQAGGILGSGNAQAAAEGQLTGLASGEASAQLSKWLQQYGTARVQANVDNHGNLDGSQFDMLLPLYNSESDLAFTQYGLRRIDKRTTANLGLGHRHFFSDWMLGYNAFLDHDLSRSHTRTGLGLEYARDYLRLSTNGYLRLSNWRDSPDLEDYRERPANGFDVRAEGWLPALPSLGAKLAYEQYFGDEVGLFGHDQRQKDPHAITAGLNYTPVPLLTVGVDRRQGTSGNGETLFNLGVNYEIGTPWAKQISPDNVGSRRTLAGGRYDLVDRNNQIVLEYQKKEVIRLSMPSRLSGRTGERKSLVYNVSTKYGLSGIEWQAPELLAAGGQILDDGQGHYSVQMPPAAGTYTLSGVARDTRGNVSQRVSTQVVVAASDISPDLSSTELTTGGLPADGRSQTTMRLTLKDRNGNPLTGQAGSIRFDVSALAGSSMADPSLGDVREVAPGVYEVVVTAGKHEGKVSITPVVDGIRLNPVEMMFDTSAHTVSAEKSSVKADKTALVADNLDSTTLTLTLKNLDGEPMTGMAEWIQLEGLGQNLKQGKITEQGNGVYTVTLTAGSLAENVTVTPVIRDVKLNAVNMVLEPHGVPAVTDLKLSGKLEVGGVLKGSYTFNAEKGDTTDHSLYLWGTKGTTESHVATDGQVVTTSGEAGEYTLKADDAGKVMELAVLATNGKGTTGNTATLATDAPSGSGNATTGGNGAGAVVSELAVPQLTFSELKVQKEQTITLTVKVEDAQKQAVADTPVIVTAISATNRQGVSQNVTLLANGQRTWSGVSGKDGTVKVPLTDPNGLGVKTTLRVTAGEPGNQQSTTGKVIFTVITSPDTDNANFFGHMAETITTKYGTFKRPPLQVEGHGHKIFKVNGEDWAAMDHNNANQYCASQSGTVPKKELLKDLYDRNHDIKNKFGWPIELAGYRSSSTASDTSHDYGVSLITGEYLDYPSGDQNYYISCRLN